MKADDSTLTMREARIQYFVNNGFGESGYNDRWVKLQAGPIPLYFPNTAARVAAVRFHDLHHVLTKYETTWTGEAEIGAWEIASGCAHHYAAWLLNLQAMAVGLVLNPKAIWQAFLHGRKTGNLYKEEYGDHLLSSTVRDLRCQLQFDAAPAPAAPSDYAAFVGWSLASLATFLTANLALFALVLLFFRLLFSA